MHPRSALSHPRERAAHLQTYKAEVELEATYQLGYRRSATKVSPMALGLDVETHPSLIHTHIIRQYHVYNLAYRRVAFPDFTGQILPYD
jgi:hypothetical protein